MCQSVCVCAEGGEQLGLIYSFHTMAFTSLPLAGVNLVGWSALFALAYVPENTMSLHRSLSQLSDKRLGRAATCASLFPQVSMHCLVYFRQKNSIPIKDIYKIHGLSLKVLDHIVICFCPFSHS